MLSCERSESADDDDDDDAGQGICHVPVLTTLVSTLTASADIDILITAPLVVLLIMSRASGGKVSSGKDSIDCPSNVNAYLFCFVAFKSESAPPAMLSLLDALAIASTSRCFGIHTLQGASFSSLPILHGHLKLSCQTPVYKSKYKS